MILHLHAIKLHTKAGISFILSEVLGLPFTSNITNLKFCKLSYEMLLFCL